MDKDIPQKQEINDLDQMLYDIYLKFGRFYIVLDIDFDEKEKCMRFIPLKIQGQTENQPSPEPPQNQMGYFS